MEVFTAEPTVCPQGSHHPLGLIGDLVRDWLGPLDSS